MITTHVLDTSLGRPASGVPVKLEHLDDTATWRLVGEGQTDADGRLRTLVAAGTVLEAGTYRIRFDTGAYHAANGVEGFFPAVDIVFNVQGSSHYHVPLLLSPFGYSTYRGS